MLPERLGFDSMKRGLLPDIGWYTLCKLCAPTKSNNVQKIHHHPDPPPDLIPQGQALSPMLSSIQGAMLPTRAHAATLPFHSWMVQWHTVYYYVYVAVAVVVDVLLALSYSNARQMVRQSLSQTQLNHNPTRWIWFSNFIWWIEFCKVQIHIHCHWNTTISVTCSLSDI